MSRIDGQNMEIHRQHLRHQKNLDKINKEHVKQKEMLDLTNKAQVESAKIDHETKVRGLRQANEIEVFDEIERKDKLLTSLKDKVDKTREVTESQLKNIKENHQKNIEKKQVEFDSRFHDKNVRNNEAIYNLNSRFEDSMKEMNENFTQKEQMSQFKHKSEMATEQVKHQTNYETMKNNFEKVHSLRQGKFEKALLTQKEKHLKQLSVEKKSHDTQTDLHRRRFKHEMDKILEKQENLKRGVQKEFEKDYQKVLSEHNKLVDNLQNRTQQLIEKGKLMLSREKANLTSKAQDSFYTAHRFTPLFKDLGDSYDILVKVPKHEVEGMNLMASGREVTISLDRRFDDKVEENGVTSKSKKFETLSTSFEVPDILDPKAKVSKSYGEGILVFNIKKA